MAYSADSAGLGDRLDVLRVPAAATLPLLRSVCSISLSSMATALVECPARIRVTANSLNSDVPCDFGIFIAFLSLVTSIIRHP